MRDWGFLGWALELGVVIVVFGRPRCWLDAIELVEDCWPWLPWITLEFAIAGP